MKVTLSWSEAEFAAHAGIKRRLLALHDNRPDFHGFKEEPWATDIESAASEMAVAKALQMWWTPWARRPQDVTADVGDRVQVRRRQRDDWDLLLHEDDPDDHAFFLVTGKLPSFTIHGYMFGADGKQERYWGDPYATGRPCFWIPQSDLEPVESFSATVAW